MADTVIEVVSRTGTSIMGDLYEKSHVHVHVNVTYIQVHILFITFCPVGSSQIFRRLM